MKIVKYVKEHPMSVLISIVYVLAGVGIGCAILGHYLGQPFDWRWFVGLDLPLYIFCGWALGKTFPIAFKIIDSEHNVEQSKSEQDGVAEKDTH